MTHEIKEEGSGHRLRDERLKCRWSQQEVADQIGTTPNTISRWELGLNKPNPYFRAKLCNLFGMTSQGLGLLSGHSQQPREAARTRLEDAALPPLVPIIGRNALLMQLQEWLCTKPSPMLAALEGLPGVGKTSLAIALAHHRAIRMHFRDGVLWAGLGPRPNILGHLRRWGSLLGMTISEMSTLTSTVEWAMALRNAIGQRRLLLVIDDAWHLDDALALRVGNASCAYLLTTRFAALAHQWCWKTVIHVPELIEAEGLELFTRLAPQVVEAEPTRVLELIQAVGGLPLAITLLGNALQAQTYHQQPRRLRQALSQLQEAEERFRIEQFLPPLERPPHLPAGTPLSLQAAIAVSDQSLDAQAQEALRALAVFPPKPASFSEQAALAVIASPITVLDHLSDAGLLESPSVGRYSLHQTIADYAFLHQTSTIPSQRLIAYILLFVKRYALDNERLAEESQTILAALEAAQALKQWSDLIHAVLDLTPSWITSGLYSVAEEQLRRACQAAMALGDERGHLQALQMLGAVLQKQGAYQPAETVLRQGLVLARSIDDRESQSALLGSLGSVHYHCGAWNQAQACYQEGLGLARQQACSTLISRHLNGLGVVATRVGAFSQAEAFYREGLTLAREHRDRQRVCILLANLGGVTEEQGNPMQAETFYQEGLALAKELGDRERACRFLMNLGVLTHAGGDDVGAEQYLRKGLAIARQIGHQELKCACLFNLGEILVEEGKESQAEECYEEGLALARQIGQREWTSNLLTNLGGLATLQGREGQAGVYFHESLSLARQIGYPKLICAALSAMGELYLRQSSKVAEDCYREMLTLVPQGARQLLGQALYGLARSALARGHLLEADGLAERSQRLFEAIGHRMARQVGHWREHLPAPDSIEQTGRHECSSSNQIDKPHPPDPLSSIDRWLQEYCQRQTGVWTPNAVFMESYRQWCHIHNVEPCSLRALVMALKARGWRTGVRSRRTIENGRQQVRGVDELGLNR
jgi:tetratricopeptide (TPR) repeat protein/transcriptional regulator with XRE-family HTH domain